jgi:Arc/MetJ family transcription regulator
MAAEKVSLTLEEDLVAEAREIVGLRGLSGYVNQALRLQLQRDRLAGLLADLDREHGPVPSEILEEVRRAWPSPGEKAAKRRHA